MIFFWINCKLCNLDINYIKKEDANITKDFNFALLDIQLKQFVKKQLLFNYQLHYQLFNPYC